MSDLRADDENALGPAAPGAADRADLNTVQTSTAAVPGGLNARTPRTTFAAVSSAVAGNAATSRAASEAKGQHAVGDEVSLPRLRVRIEGFLGKGGEAEVYRVTLLQHESERSRPLEGGAVLKRYKEHCRLDTAVRDTWRTLPPNVVIPLLDDHVVPGGAENWELLATAEGGALVSGDTWEPFHDEARLRHMIRQMATAIAALHAGRVVHRDISPDNFLWRDAARTELVLGDLGLARVVAQGSVHSTHAGGKHGYMAPEGVALAFDVEDALELNVRVAAPLDWYALGVSISALRWGGHPKVTMLTTYSRDDIAQFKRERRVPLAPDLPEDIRVLCECLTAYDPGQRAGHHDILRWLRGERLSPPTAGAAEDPYPALTVRLGGDNVLSLKSPRDLAKVYRGNRAAGARHFFLTAWTSSAWASRDGELTAVLDAVKGGDRSAQPPAAFEQAVYLLDPWLPFQDPVSAEDYPTAAALVEWLEAAPTRVSGLHLVTHPLWAYLEARLWHETGTLDLAAGRRTLAERSEALTGDLYMLDAVLALRPRVLAGEHEALALMRRQLQSWAFQGGYRGPDGRIHEHVAGLLVHVQTADAAKDYLEACRDESDALGVWLVERDSTIAVRLLALRRLNDEEVAASAPWTWLTALLGRIWNDEATAIGPDGPDRPALAVDVWQHPYWQNMTPEEAFTTFEPFLRLATNQSATLAARDWLASEPCNGPRIAVAELLLTTRWASLAAAPKGIELGVAAVLRGVGDASSPEDVERLLGHAARQLRREIAEVDRATPQPVSAEFARLEAVTALGVSLSARALTPETHPAERERRRALLESLAPDLRAAFVAACTAHARHPDVLNDVLAWRAALRDAVAPLQLSPQARWAAEDAQLAVLASALDREERQVAQERVKKLVREANEVRRPFYEDHLARTIGGSAPSVSFWAACVWCMLGGLAYLAWRVASPTLVSEGPFFGQWYVIRTTFWAVLFAFLVLCGEDVVTQKRGEWGGILAILVALIFYWQRDEVIAGTTWLWTALMLAILGCGARALFAAWRSVRSARQQSASHAFDAAAVMSLVESATTPARQVWADARAIARERWLCCAAAVVTATDPSAVTTATVPAGAVAPRAV